MAALDGQRRGGGGGCIVVGGRRRTKLSRECLRARRGNALATAANASRCTHPRAVVGPIIVADSADTVVHVAISHVVVDVPVGDDLAVDGVVVLIIRRVQRAAEHQP